MELPLSIDGSPERDLSWLDSSFRPDLSSDGRRILFSDASASSTFYSVCLRNTDGSPVIRLGEGSAVGLSPDGAWALALLLKDPPEIEFLPTGPGEARTLKIPNIERYTGVGWMPDSKHFIFAANEPGRGSRFYVRESNAGSPRAVTPEGFTARLNLPVSPDGKRFLGFNENTGAWNLCQTEDGKCSPVSGFEKKDAPLQWSSDGKYIYVGSWGHDLGLWRIEVATGRRQLWKNLAPADPVGVLEGFATAVTPDGKSFASEYVRSFDQLYLADSAN